jgi:predicted branched-subunit amino acid permease
MAMGKSTVGVPLSLLMTLLVAAGTPQLTALPLITADAPMSVVWVTAACTNLRFIVFGLYYRPYFVHLPLWRRVLASYFVGDIGFSLFDRHYPTPQPEPGQVHYFMGGGVFCYVVWQVAAIVGIVGGQAIPSEWGFGFAGTMVLLALTCGQLRDISTGAAALVAASAALAAYALPLRLNIMVAVAAAVAVGVLAHTTREQS